MGNRIAELCCFSVLTLTAACGQTADEPGPAPESGASCDAARAWMSTCYPDLATEAVCTENTLDQFERLGLEGEPNAESCGKVESLGKADFFAFGGCPSDQHVCGWMFCCDDYRITWKPSSEADWDILEVVRSFQAAAPDDKRAAIESSSRSELEDGVSESWTQKVAEYPDDAPQELAVHLTRVLAEVPYDAFIKILPTERWGVELAHYLGGEVQVYEQDDQGRATRQLERMVLSPMPFDYETPLSNNDMTKVELIHYGDAWSTVYWRVMHSDNNSTVTDVGSVDFRAYDDRSTLITFHSAHKLNAPGGIPLPNAILKIALRGTFLDFARGYRDLTEAAY